MSLNSDWLARQGEDAALLSLALVAHGSGKALPARLGVAVSGGSDSMAVLHLLARAAPRAGWALHAATVDHRLRPESAEEAAFVGRFCHQLGVPHDVLVWDHGDIAGNLMQAASKARYALMADWARGTGIDQIVLGHTADDQAETFLMGLTRAAGLDGLSGMQRAFLVKTVDFRRPFLSVTRAALRAYLTRHDVPWVDDPSNDNERFSRVKARRALRALRPLGITVDRLSCVVHHLSMAQGVVRNAVATTAKGIVTETAGALNMQRSDFRMCDPEVQRRLLIAMVRWIGGARHVPREARIIALGRALDLGKDATLGGVRFRWKGDTCTVLREARACEGPVPAGCLWDGRWRVTGATGEIRALGAEGLRHCPDWRRTGLPRQVLEVTPGLWEGERLVAAPVAGLGPGAATCAPSFHDTLLSH